MVVNHGSSRTVVAGRVVVNNRQVDLQNLKELNDLPDRRRAGRAEVIRSGADFLQQAPRFPAHRACVDLPWAVLFLLTLLALISFVATSAGELGELGSAASRHLSSSYGYGGPVDGQAMSVDSGPRYAGQAMPWDNGSGYVGQAMPVDNGSYMSESEAGALLVTSSLACVAGAAGGLILASMWIMFAQTCASTVVYFSLYAIPTLFLVAGVLTLLAGSVHGGIMLCLVVFTVESCCAWLVAYHWPLP
eukprot:s2004_g18.t1